MRKWMALVLAICLALPAAALAGPAEAAETVLRGMSTEQKIAQLLMPSFYYRTDAEGKRQSVTRMTPEMEDVLREYGFGGVIYNLQNALDNENAARLAEEMQVANAAAGHPQLITSTDQEGGYVSRLGKGTQMPGSMALGAAGDLAVTEAAGRLIGEEVRAIGYSGTFGPVLDVNSNPANPIINVRSFSDDPEIVAAHGIAFLKGLHDAGALATLKHFPGHGDTDTDSHTGLPCVNKSYEALKAFELVPFQACIDAGADMIMTAHIVYPQVETGTYVSVQTGETIGLPATFSRTILTDILRGDMGFTGLIVTDAMNMDAVAKHFDPLDAARRAIEAGVDLILRPVDTEPADGIAALKQYIRDVAAMADDGRLSMEAVDAAVLRVLRFKESRGMLGAYAARGGEELVRAAGTVGSPEHHARELEIAKRAVTLVKNDGILPLNAGEGLAILVPYASQLKSAEYALGLLREAGRIPADLKVPVRHLAAMTVGDLVTLAQGTRHILAVSTCYSAAGINPDKTNGSDTALLDTVITLAHAAGNDVTVISSHLPYDLAHFQRADALAACYGARGMTENPSDARGTVSQYGPNIPAAIYMLLSGEPTTGRLPVDIPVMDAQNAFTEEILYARGFGL